MSRYFYGIKVKVLISAPQGIPVEFCFVPGSQSDIQALKKQPMAVTPGSNIYGDSGDQIIQLKMI